MAKRYRVKWTPVVEIKECRGLKRAENPLLLQHKEKYIENILFPKYLTILKTEVHTRTQLEKWRVSLRESVRSFRLSGPHVDGQVLYCDQEVLDTEGVRQLLSWYHRKNARGSYHLYDDKRMIVRKGQLVVPTSYHIASICRGAKHQQWYGYRTWKKRIRLWFSEWEVEEVMSLLLMQAVCDTVTSLQWVRDVYGDRADYMPTLQTKDIKRFFFWHLLEGK